MAQHCQMNILVMVTILEKGRREGEVSEVACIEMRRRHDDLFVRLWNDLEVITSLMNHQVQHVMDDCACNAQDDRNRTDKKTQRANGDTHQHAPSI